MNSAWAMKFQKFIEFLEFCRILIICVVHIRDGILKLQAAIKFYLRCLACSQIIHSRCLDHLICIKI